MYLLQKLLFYCSTYLSVLHLVKREFLSVMVDTICGRKTSCLLNLYMVIISIFPKLFCNLSGEPTVIDFPELNPGSSVPYKLWQTYFYNIWMKFTRYGHIIFNLTLEMYRNNYYLFLFKQKLKLNKRTNKKKQQKKPNNNKIKSYNIKSWL